MAETTARAAADALAASVRVALQCLAAVETLNSGWEIGVPNTLRVIPRGAESSGLLQLRRPDRSLFLQLKVSLDYSVILDADGSRRPAYRSEVSRYVYVVRDLTGGEIFAYHLHPHGVSDVLTPHLHVSAARDVSLSSQGGTQKSEVISLGKLHFPTHQIQLPELVRFLITELGVGSRRPDWEAVLDRVERSAS